MKHRWPRSLHSQVEALFHCIRAIGDAKDENPLGIRSFGSWRVYKYEAHQFADSLIQQGVVSILDTEPVAEAMEKYLEDKLNFCVKRKLSRQTFETTLSALGKLEFAVNTYIYEHEFDCALLDVERLRKSFYIRSKTVLPMSSRDYGSRAYPDPLKLIERISDPVFRLQAALQFSGGFRCEGVGAPRNQELRNPLTAQSLRGLAPDPVTGQLVGNVASVEKGGKETIHYVSLEIYRHLENYIQLCGKLESDYHKYIAAINQAARETGQFASGRASHGLKHSFAQERYFECVNHGLSHEEALQETSIELGHFRLRETLTYTRGRK